MRPAPFSVIDSRTVTDALSALCSEPERTKVLAGGQDLLGDLNRRRLAPSILVDIRNIPALRRIRFYHQQISIGSAVRQHEIQRAQTSEATGSVVSVLGKVAAAAGPRAVRTLGTIGGNIASSRPGTVWAPALSALGARVQIAAATGELMTLHVPDAVRMVRFQEGPAIAVSAEIPEGPVRLVVARAPLPTEAYPSAGVCAIAVRDGCVRVAISGPGGVESFEAESLQQTSLPSWTKDHVLSPSGKKDNRRDSDLLLTGLYRRAVATVLAPQVLTIDRTVVVNAESHEQDKPASR
ncbi:FAD binding domain-containing protein [Paenarthrobacter sp. NPDC089675]|uniref:FAD binding domain-containing protein n=1 Tax=Paenarthrobacter sp. NPDC089675 TaxID=3364376 RepID=UPI00382245D5